MTVAGPGLEWRLRSPVAVCYHLLLLACSCMKDLSILPEWVMFKRAPVAFRCTLISLDFANLVKGPKAPDLAILALLSSCVARLVIHPTALH